MLAVLKACWEDSPKERAEMVHVINQLRANDLLASAPHLRAQGPAHGAAAHAQDLRAFETPPTIATQIIAPAHENAGQRERSLSHPDQQTASI